MTTARRSRKGIPNKKGRLALVTRECHTCGNPVTRTKGNFKVRCFCSPECNWAWRRTLTGEKSGTWRGGRSHYRGPNWPEARKAALERDRHRCTVCGRPNGGTRRDHLEVNHKIPFRNFDSYLEANRLDNLETLCVHCHRKFDGYLRLTKVAPPVAIRRTIICVDCGTDFWSQSGTARRCVDCRPAYNRAANRRRARESRLRRLAS